MVRADAGWCGLHRMDRSAAALGCRGRESRFRNSTRQPPRVDRIVVARDSRDLLRKLVSADFTRVDFRHFTLLSFVVSSTLFGLLHQQWLAGVIAGMLFAVAMYRRGALFDAVIAHSTANAMLAVYILTTHRWSLWN